MGMNLPIMQCDRGCGACCGIVACNETEYKQVIGFAKNRGIEPIQQGSTCPFYQDGECKVYDARPFVCKIFGHFKDARMTCCRGYNTNVSEGERAKIEKDYRRKNGHLAIRYLHEACYSAVELRQIIKDAFEKATAV